MSLPMISNLSNQLAQKLDIQGSGQDLVSALKATAFKGNVNDSQMIALLVIANQYGLNPWTKEIYAFPQSGGIVPIVGVDGWLRIINSHPQFDGMEFEQDDEKCTCTIYRKDRTRPTSVTEYLSECKRNTDPWKQHAKRMLRHKAMMQCARYAFGLALNDHDDANDIIEKDITPHNDATDVDVIEMITSDQSAKISALIDSTNSKRDGFLNFFGIDSVESMTKEQYEQALEMLNQKVAKQKKGEAQKQASLVAEGDEVEL